MDAAGLTADAPSTASAPTAPTTSDPLTLTKQRNQRVSRAMQRQAIVNNAERQVGARINALAQDAKAARAEQAKSAPALADDVYQFEPLAQVRARVTKIMDAPTAQ